jgi:uncharacterized delta-60 repeat protein
MQTRNQSIRIVFYAMAMIAMLVVTPTVCRAAEGDLVWATRAGGTDDDRGRSVAALPDGSVLVAGTFRGTSTFGAGELNETTLVADSIQEPLLDIFLARYNPDGTLAWAQHAVREAGSGNVVEIAALPDGSAYVTGSFGKVGSPPGYQATFGPGDPNETRLFTVGMYDLFVARYNPDGTLAWAKRAGGLFGAGGYAAEVLSDGSVAVLGAFSRTATFGLGEPNETVLDSGDRECFIARYNADGTLA